MEPKRLISTSKMLSKTLRHDPSRLGLTLDAQGWVGVDELLAALETRGRPLTRAELDEVVEGNDKRRFTIADGRIRANQGHSIAIDLALAATEPPALLFHGTATRNLEAILAEGLDRGRRHHVHLSADTDTAVRVGARHGKPVVLTVLAGMMAAEGHEFYVSANGVWLAEHVPATYLRAP
ncbi:RNA 2'-phosphotransferase [Phytomonospora endophytica]|uniref:Probable RNA 2'-phosphotransferase n=1 Tax=Phytomonospora endophytica TaxID=714109 RepID=A0A841FHW5_9ACTN|nr:RNA 2'-phosphotransferase [Phytomonospora endophytica]MBB6034553.1 putative RNA 2'-phosphotransferase [Phytomonospora endophytica]GIG70462.1 putative RNA 2'-phosphotransferase [Phytomonospora endophytica]